MNAWLRRFEALFISMLRCLSLALQKPADDQKAWEKKLFYLNMESNKEKPDFKPYLLTWVAVDSLL